MVQFRRSLYVTRDLKAGETLSTENLRSIRPGFGLPPKHLPDLIGRRVTRDVARGTPFSWDLVD
jgi:N-acetylneuraminate synthase